MQAQRTDTTSVGSRAIVMRSDRVDVVVVGAGQAGLARKGSPMPSSWLRWSAVGAGLVAVAAMPKASRFLSKLRLHPQAMPIH